MIIVATYSLRTTRVAPSFVSVFDFRTKIARHNIATRRRVLPCGSEYTSPVIRYGLLVASRVP